MIVQLISSKAIEAVQNLFGVSVPASQLAVQRTIPSFRNQGDFSLVVFPLLKVSRKSPEETARLLGDELLRLLPEAESFGVVKGYLNIRIIKSYWEGFVKDNHSAQSFGVDNQPSGKPVVVEYSSPNTNKPLHLGHVRNNLLGYSVSQILKASGKNVAKVNLVNDRGIHICKSMLAWKLSEMNETPESSGKKGDKLVGDYYVLFDKMYKTELKELVDSGKTEDEAAAASALMAQAREMLLKWEARDPETLQLWNMMNEWVYAGFDVTYKRLGVDFDKIYYESQTYLFGKEIVEEGLKSGVLFRKDDSSVWIDLTADGLDEKLLLRSDGTSVYMTQDLGTAQLRANDFNPESLVYVVGNEQNYHFEVLKLILQKLGRPWADHIYHLSYGMVELPEGKMKSREGTVVDADDLMDEMIVTARAMTEELGKIEDFDSEEAQELYRIVGLGALKYFILKVDPRKNMLFNPADSIDFNGNTGPFIQYTYARIKSVLRKAEAENIRFDHFEVMDFHSKESDLIISLYEFPATVKQAAADYSPAIMASYLYDLARDYNTFYHELSILKEENESKKALRLAISSLTATVIKNGMQLLGIEVPERM
ncbi:MAG: arginine--tRNA ligase [Bacteroidetes bacterium HGW-Bacteroidetes-11]|nr:MAG: arginine--tRNA ligase [Bacteroidetes bacterium HGW-Bacteroidetes-11]